MQAKAKRGFTLIEMLVVIAIIAVLIAATIGGYTGVTRMAQKARARELVANVASGLTILYDAKGAWPKRLVQEGARDGKLDEQTARLLYGYVTLNVKKDSAGKVLYDDTGAVQELVGHDRFGLVTPWATALLKRKGSSAELSSPLGGGNGTVADHLLHFAVDTDDDGIVTASVGGEGVNVRAKAIVWCCGPDGKIEAYSKGVKGDGVYSWSVGQTRNVK